MKRSLVTVLALSFTLVFSFIFLKLFVDEAIVTSSNQAIVYYLQVGVFKSLDNANGKVEQLKQNDIEAYYHFQDDLYFVVTGFSLDKNEKDIQKQILIENEITCYDKQVVVTDASIIEQMQSNSYAKLLEVLAVYK